MKKYCLLLLLIGITFPTQAQTYIPGSLGLTAGVGLNPQLIEDGLMFFILRVPLVYTAVGELALNKNFSLGIAGSYTQFKENPNATLTPLYQKLNVGIRTTFLLPPISAEKLHVYVGTRVGHSFWRASYNGEPISLNDVPILSPVSIQAYLGVNAFLFRKMAINVEVGTPGPYFFQMGLHFKSK